MKCPGCGQPISFIYNRPRRHRKAVGPMLVEHTPGCPEHTPERCRTASGYAALVDAARGADACIEKLDAAIWDAHYGRGISADYARERAATAKEALAALRAALGALR